ncbi:hypothetical protein X922_16830 [Pseudomonas aeruginosa VRFPA08]|nr:hypothetical protein X922_16830 [Pseudomonas aeruginosa VRFPA08]
MLGKLDHFIRIQVLVIDTALNHVKDIDKPPANQWMITIGWIPVRQDHMGNVESFRAQ